MRAFTTAQILVHASMGSQLNGLTTVFDLNVPYSGLAMGPLKRLRLSGAQGILAKVEQWGREGGGVGGQAVVSSLLRTSFTLTAVQGVSEL